MDKIRTAIYARVSTNKQELENQLAQLRAAAQNRGLEVVKEYTDIESGSTVGASGYTNMKASANNGEFKTLVVYSVDRLTRRGIEAVFRIIRELESAGVNIISLREPFFSTAGPERDLLISIIAWVAEYERGRISDRTKAALARKKAAGMKLGGRKKGAKDLKPRKRRNK